MSENASAASMPSTVASLLTTALLDRSEFRSSLHFNQMSVPSWDIICALCFVLGTLLSVAQGTSYQVPSTKHKVQR